MRSWKKIPGLITAAEHLRNVERAHSRYGLTTSRLTYGYGKLEQEMRNFRTSVDGVVKAIRAIPNPSPEALTWLDGHTSDVVAEGENSI
jgi:hypothetical protein